MAGEGVANRISAIIGKGIMATSGGINGQWDGDMGITDGTKGMGITNQRDGDITTTGI